ncbi:hypothetical protein MOE90_20455 [Bacillus spizizenii]|nr:hypothetical protein [Bacillus spizizenii]MCY9124932.1 hypothetical protein [Bacillus spizizenii]
MIKKLINKVLKKENKCDERVSILIFVNDHNEVNKYFKLFKFMLRDKLERTYESRFEKFLITDEFRIYIRKAGTNQRGMRANYVLNLHQNKEFDYIEQTYMGLTDSKWSELF